MESSGGIVQLHVSIDKTVSRVNCLQHCSLLTDVTLPFNEISRAEDFRALLNCIFCYDWKSDVKVNVAVIHLINEIVSTNSTFLGRAFQLYVKSLLPSMTTSLSTGKCLSLLLIYCYHEH